MLKKVLAPIYLILLISCAALTSVKTPEGKAAYTADQFITSLGIFQDAAIGANSQGLLSERSTRLIVNFTKSAVLTAQQSPSGWKATVTTGLNQLKKDLPAADARKYEIYINLLATMIGGL